MIRRWIVLLVLSLVCFPVLADVPVKKQLRTDIYLKQHAWLRHQAEQGDPGAQFNLAYMYYMSGTDPRVTGIIHSKRLAARWYRKSAQQGHSGAQFNMAALYINGDGVDRDPVKAYSWLTLASEQGHARARKLKEDLEQVLDQQQLGAAAAESDRMRRRSGAL
jgi:TPR repeat protein